MAQRNWVSTDTAFRLLRLIYRSRGVELASCSELTMARYKSDIDRDSDILLSIPSPDQRHEELDKLVDRGLLGRSGSLYELTVKGLSYMQSAAEKELCDRLGWKKLDLTRMRIESVVDSTLSLGVCKLRRDEPADYIKHMHLNLWGSADGIEPILFCVVDLIVIDSEAAAHHSTFSLEDILLSRPETTRFLRAIENHDEGGQPAAHIYELAQMLDLDEALGRHLVLVDDMRISPALIGKGIGPRIARKLALLLGHGGGIIVFPVNMYRIHGGMKSARGIERTIIESYFDIGMIPHRFQKDFMVADIQKLSGLP